jgi:glutathione peroxidase-family protein
MDLSGILAFEAVKYKMFPGTSSSRTVNVASTDVFTRPYGDLERLHRTYSDRGFAVLGFPSDDFDHQDMGPSGDTERCSTSNDTEVCSTANVGL